MRLKDRVAIVTGAGSGIGQATAQLFAENGARVLAVDLPQTDLAAAHGGVNSIEIWEQSVAEPDGPATIVARAVELFGRLDILFNNAGTANPMKVEDMPLEVWEQELAVHAKGVFLGTRAVIPAMRQGGGGSIINTSSVMGLVGSPTTPAYSAAKGAIALFTKSAALQYAKENIRINSVHPGYADTPLTEQRFADPAVRESLLKRTPMGRLGTAMDIANGVLFLASDESSWVTGSALVIDGGMTAQ